ncbi:LysE family translocator [Aquimarina pacifica]|uniref:LysE family translocator n=1 Tax=Aquimarina pacifica TaxID=1296415 RepID=UPI00046FA6D0|nr:LysE family transporter [Aquimarina pacifica]
MAFIEGYGIGLGMIIFIGPVFFLLLKSSLQYGYKAGVAIALGIIFSDIICVVLCYYGLFSFVNSTENQFFMGLIGSLIIFILGISYLLKKTSKNHPFSIRSKGVLPFFLKGFSINFFNPFVFAVWIGVYNYGQNNFNTNSSLLTFIIAVLAGIFTTDLLKVFLSKKVKKFANTKRLEVFFKVTGIVLIIFSVRILYSIW